MTPPLQPRMTDQRLDRLLRELLTERAEDVAADALSADAMAERIATRLRRTDFGRAWMLLAAAALLVALAAGAIAVGSGLTRTLPSGGGAIAYTGANFGWDRTLAVADHAIMSVSVDGDMQERLAAIPGEPAVDPLEDSGRVAIGPAVRWSPDGRQLAFRLENGPRGLYVMNRDGSDLRLIAEATDHRYEEGVGGNANFAWSPDGSRIAFISPDRKAWPPGSGPNGQLWIVNVETGVVQELANEANGSVSWSPDGSKIAFGRSQPSHSDVVIVNADGTGERSYRFNDGGGSHPGAIAWSPDSSRVAFLQLRFPEPTGSYVMVVSSNGTDAREIADFGNQGCCFHGAFGGLLEWSSDGTVLATPVLTDDGPRIRVISADGSGIQSDIPGDWFDWSPDGTQLVIAAPGPAVPGAPTPLRRSSIYIVNADGTGQRWLADGDYPAWSPTHE